MIQSKFRGKVLPFVLFLPSVVISVLFLYYPAFQSFMLSFYKTAFFGRKRLYVGWGNFIEIFTSSEYLNSVWVSTIFSVGVVILELVICLAVALMINRITRFKKIYITLLLLPYALSPALAGVVFRFLFDPVVGTINYFLDLSFGIKPNWLGQGYLTLIVVIITATWKRFGYTLIFLLAALQNIPGEVLEAAEIDGAGFFRMLRKITLPLLSPVLLFLIIMNSIYSFFGTFAMIDIMTRGGPMNMTNILIYNLYRTAFIYTKSGLAAAQSVVLFALVAGLIFFQFRASRKRVFYLGA